MRTVVTEPLADAPGATVAIRRLRAGWIVLALAAAGVAQQIVLVARYLRTLTVEDQNILWFAAREWAGGNLREPGYYGQTYGTTFESIPVAALWQTGVKPSVGLPLVLAFATLASWLLVAAAALKGGRPVMAIAAAAAPLVLDTQYLFVTGFYGAATGRLLVTAGLAAWVAWPRRTGSMAAAWGLGALGTVLDFGAFILAAPLAVHTVFAGPPVGLRARARKVGVAALALLPALAWQSFVVWFYRVNPDHDLHRSPRPIPGLEVLGKALGRTDRFWSIFSPELLRWWVAPLAVTVVLVALLVATRRAAFVAPALTAVTVYLFALSTSRALDGPSPFLPEVRIVLLLPFTVWFLLWLVAEAGLPMRVPVRGVVAAGLIVAVVVVSLGLRVISADDRWDTMVASARRNLDAFPVVTVSELGAACERVRDLADRFGTDFVYYAGWRSGAYGCGALDYERLTTLVPDYERRTWLLEQERDGTRTSMLIYGVDGQFCARWDDVVTTCFVDTGVPAGTELGIAAVAFPRQSSLEFLESIEVRIRPFGPDCSPRRPETCSD